MSGDVVSQGSNIAPIPERRPTHEKRVKPVEKQAASGIQSFPLPIWRCRVCGYLCARDGPPEICPICKANRDRFEKFV